ncbi:hypothetical protein LXL04_014600 [Taraxacum kok-saghyz]
MEAQNTVNQNMNLRDEPDPVIDVDNETNQPVNDVNDVNVEIENKGYRPKRSFVWEHFTFIEGSKSQVKCPYCSIKMAGGTKKHGTSAMSYHLKNVCRRSPLFRKGYMKNHATLNFKPKPKGESGGSLASHHFNQEKARKFLARMCIKDNKPFSMVDDEGLMEFEDFLQCYKKVSGKMSIKNK